MSKFCKHLKIGIQTKPAEIVYLLTLIRAPLTSSFTKIDFIGLNFKFSSLTKIDFIHPKIDFIQGRSWALKLKPQIISTNLAFERAHLARVSSQQNLTEKCTQKKHTLPPFIPQDCQPSLEYCQ